MKEESLASQRITIDTVFKNKKKHCQDEKQKENTLRISQKEIGKKLSVMSKQTGLSSLKIFEDANTYRKIKFMRVNKQPALCKRCMNDVRAMIFKDDYGAKIDGPDCWILDGNDQPTSLRK